MERLNPIKISAPHLLSIELDQSVLKAHALMVEKKIRHLIVTNSGAAIGVVSDRDLMKAMHIEIEDFYSVQVKRESMNASLVVRDVMSWPMKTVNENTPLLEVVDIMIKDKISALLVLKSGSAKVDELVNIVTTEDLLLILKEHLNKDASTGTWATELMEQFYKTPIQTILAALSNSGI